MGQVSLVRDPEFELSEGFSIGDFRVFPRLNRIQKGDNVTQVEPKIMEVLVLIVARRGHVVKREEIFDHVWKDVFVNEITLTRVVSELRKMFEDQASNPKYIETIRKVGYRFIHDIQWHNPSARQTTPSEDRPKRVLELASDRPQTNNPYTSLKWVIPVVVAGCLFLGWLVWPQKSDANETEEFLPHFRQQKPLVQSLDVEICPTISSDGGSLLFSRTSKNGESKIFIKDLNSNKQPVCISGERKHCSSPTWGPGASKLAYLSKTEQLRAEIIVHDLVEDREWSASTRFASLKGNVRWSPTRNFLAFSSFDYDKKSGGIYLFDLDSGETNQITFNSSPFLVDNQAEWSTDGEKISFVRPEDPQKGLLYIYELETGELHSIKVPVESICSHAWIDSNTLILDQYDEIKNMTIGVSDKKFSNWIYYVDQNKAIPIQEYGGHVCQARYYPNLQRLVFNVMQLEAPKILMAKRQQGQNFSISEADITSMTLDAQPNLSSDGEQLAFISKRFGTQQLWISKINGDDLTCLTEPESGELSCPRWSPDGTLITFLKDENLSRKSLWIINPETKKKRQLPTPSAHLFPPTWSRDGKFIYVGMGQGMKWGLMKISLDGEQELIYPDGLRALESEDGAYLFLSKINSPELIQYDLGTKQETLMAEISPNDKSLFEIVQGKLLFVSRASDGDVLISKDPVTLSEVPFGKFPKGKICELGLGEISVSTDANTLFFDSGIHMNSDIFMSQAKL